MLYKIVRRVINGKPEYGVMMNEAPLQTGDILVYENLTGEDVQGWLLGRTLSAMLTGCETGDCLYCPNKTPEENAEYNRERQAEINAMRAADGEGPVRNSLGSVQIDPVDGLNESIVADLNDILTAAGF